MSRNYSEDQKNELEALESIYYNELESNSSEVMENCRTSLIYFHISVIENEPYIKFMIKISTEDFAETEDGLTTDLVFTFTAKYPDVGPKVEIENENVSEPEIFFVF